MTQDIKLSAETMYTINQAQSEMAMAKLQLQNTQLAHKLILTQVERDYGFKLDEVEILPDGTVRPKIPMNRPKPIPPAVEEKVKKEADRGKSEAPKE
jgi:hypothetical protein